MFLRATSAAALLDLPLSTFHQLVREGTLPPPVSKLGRHRLWSREQLVAVADPRGYKAAHEHQAAAGRSPAGPAKRPGEVRLPDRPGNAPRRPSSEVARRSPYAGILGSFSGGKELLHRDIRWFADTFGHQYRRDG